MDSSETSTERALADVALNGDVRSRVLLGGLGLGYTATQLLAANVDHLDVVEIEECLVEWAYAGLTATLAAVANDPGAVSTSQMSRRCWPAAPQRSRPGHGTPSCSTSTTGPTSSSTATTPCSTRRPCAAASAQLTAGGTLAVWCQGPQPSSGRPRRLSDGPKTIPVRRGAQMSL